MNEYEKNLIKIKKLKKAKFLLINSYVNITMDIEEILEIGLDFVIKTTNGYIKNLKYDTWIQKIQTRSSVLEVLQQYKTIFEISFSNRIIGFIVAK